MSEARISKMAACSALFDIVIEKTETYLGCYIKHVKLSVSHLIYEFHYEITENLVHNAK